MHFNPQLTEKIQESLSSILPITAIVLMLSISVAPLTPGALVLFLFGAVLLTVGIGVFTLGVDMSMMPMGSGIGEAMGKGAGKAAGKAAVFLSLFALGALVTVAEPDLQVLCHQVPVIPDRTLLFAVAAGVGLLLVLALARMEKHIPLSTLLTGLYALVFVLLCFAPADFIPVAFDSGGVTTGPITVPFIMALGVGLARVRSDRTAAADSFGLIALCSVGPILSVLLLGIFYPADSTPYAPAELSEILTTRDAAQAFVRAVPTYCKEVAIALLPIVAVFAVFQLCTRRFKRTQCIRILTGLTYAYVGLVLFLSGVNVGFLPAGQLIGRTVAAGEQRFLLIPIGMLMGYFIVAAEPAVHVLIRQVEEVSMGAISKTAMRRGLSVGVALSVGIAMLRVLTGVSILWFLLPGYAISLVLTFFVPQMFTGVAFDAGGVASGPMTATFLLPFSAGACQALGGDLMRDAFGLVAMVAMTPLLTIQLLGLAGRVRRKLASDALRARLAQTENRMVYYR